MSLINDVKHELRKLDLSIKSLRKFGFVVGFIFFIIGLLLLSKNIFDLMKFLFLSIGSLLFLFGIFYPKSLLIIYKIWMGLAFILGWFTSRFLLTIMFLIVLTPIALFAKIMNRQFLKLSSNKNENTFWIATKSKKINYEKMY